MTGRIMDGRELAQEVRAKVRGQISALGQEKIQVKLTTILVGDNPASKLYVKNKHVACQEAGIKSANLELPSTISQDELEQSLQSLNDDSAVTGILLQLPLPEGLDESHALRCVALEKDVDGLHPSNLGRLFDRPSKPGLLVPCTPKGVMVLLNYYGVELARKRAVVINRTKLVGRPLAQLLLNKDATVTVCHSQTTNLAELSRDADLLVTGIGRRSEFTVGADMIKPGSTLIDIGTSSIGGKMMGDVDFHSALNIAALVTPVPGGVGPMTIAMLLFNTLVAACIQNRVELRFNPDELKPPERV
jgi:methylenetetrahydrofolate dehydrogenase (NADP+)/methenyltetrahydrofolate cyclohydrolase